MMRKPLTLDHMRALADVVGRREDVPPSLLLAVARHESGGFYPDAHRGEPHLNDSSHGLMQLLLATARGLGYSGPVGAWDATRNQGTGLYDPETNLTLGARFLKQLHARTGDLAATLSAYNAGLGNAKRATVPSRFCLEWKPTAPATGRVLDRDCKTIRSVKVGEFPNQPYVDRVMGYLASFGGSPTMPVRYAGAAGSGGGVGPAAGSPAGPSPSASPAGAPQPTFVLRTAPVVLLAALGVIAWLLRRAS